MSSLLEQLLAVTAAGPSSDAQAQAQLAHGREMLARGQREAAAVALRAAALAPATRLQAHNLIEQHRLTGCFGDWMGLDARIDPADDVYGFFTGHGSWSSPLRDYLADGWRTLSELMLLLERSGRALTDCATVLEFASGHGRFTRHLVKALGADRVTVSDVVPGAVEFARATFGVQAFVSASQPQAMRCPGRYDLVFVLSLFSHLPRTTWAPWLARLWDTVAPGGVLVLTTHGPSAIERAGVSVDAEGFHFVAASESNAIDAQEYGTAFTSEHFVRTQLATLAPKPARVGYGPTWFWMHQDAWVLERPLSVAGGAS